MSLLGTIVGAGPAQARHAHGAEDSATVLEAFLGSRTQAGKTVTVESALGLAAVWACVRLLEGSIGQLPLIVYERLDDDGRRRAQGHPAHRLLGRQPNAEMTPRFFWGLVMTHLATWGNAYLGKTFAGGRVAELWPIIPKRVRVERRNGQKLFWVRDAKGVERRTPYTSAEIIHVVGFSLDGLTGLSPIGMAREAVGAGLAMDEYLNRFYSNSAMPRIVLQSEKELSKTAAERLERRFNKLYRGVSKAHKTAVLEEGLKAEVLSLSAKDMEFVAQQNLTAKAAARIFGIPASRIDAELNQGLTYRNIAEDDLQLLKYGLAPWLVQLEQTVELDPDLFPPERPLGVSRFFPEFLTDALLRVDAKTRAEIHRTATGSRPWMKPSEIRRIENLPPDDSLDEAPPSAEPAGEGDELSERERVLKEAESLGLAAQRLGLAMDYGVLSDEEARDVIGFEGPGPGAREDDPAPVPPPAPEPPEE